MSIDTYLKNNPIPHTEKMRLLLATSDSETIGIVLSRLDKISNLLLKICIDPSDLLSTLNQDPPDFLLLGKLDDLYWFDICDNCRQLNANLPIILLSKVTLIDDFFCRWAAVKGATQVIDPEFINVQDLLDLRQQPILANIANTLGKDNIFTARVVLKALTEICEFSQTFFGTLAQGNYWRKAHAKIVDEFPALQNWYASHFGTITCYESMLDCELTLEELQSLRLWIRLFIQEGERVIDNFGEILLNAYLSPQARKLLVNN